MLVAQSIPVILGQTLTDGVESALLLQQDGSILGSKGVSAEDQTQSNLATAIEACSLWSNYAQAASNVGKYGGKEQSLKCCVVECEGRRLCVVEVSKLLLCLVATPSVGLGMLRRKAAVLANQFQGMRTPTLPPEFQSARQHTHTQSRLKSSSASSAPSRRRTQTNDEACLVCGCLTPPSPLLPVWHLCQAYSLKKQKSKNPQNNRVLSRVPPPPHNKKKPPVARAGKKKKNEKEKNKDTDRLLTRPSLISPPPPPLHRLSF